MNDLELMIAYVQEYIYQRKGVHVKIYVRNFSDINKLKFAYDFAVAYNNKTKT